MAVVHKQKSSVTASSGSATDTILAGAGLLKQILVEATTATTTFDFKLTDIHGLVVFEVTSVTGKHNEVVSMPCYGNYTLTVSNSSADEVLTYLFTVLEQY